MKDCSIGDISTIIKNVDTIVLSAHINPDGDALGSLLGLGLALEKLQKKVYYLIDDNIPYQYLFLKNIDKIQKPEENKLINADLFIVLDVGDLDRLGKVVDVVNAKQVLNIDHHISNTGFSNLRFLDVKAAATSEIVFDIIKDLSVDFDKDIATALYAGIVSDCGFFRYANTTEKTLSVASKLVGMGVKPNEVSEYLEEQSVDYIKILPKVLSTLDFELNNRIATISIDTSLYKDDMDGDAFIKYPRYISGVEVAILFKGVEEKITRVSMRSKSIDVSKIATTFGGGGHVKASGCTINEDINTAKKLLIEALEKQMVCDE